MQLINLERRQPARLAVYAIGSVLRDSLYHGAAAPHTLKDQKMTIKVDRYMQCRRQTVCAVERIQSGAGCLACVHGEFAFIRL